MLTHFLFPKYCAILHIRNIQSLVQ